MRIKILPKKMTKQEKNNQKMNRLMMKIKMSQMGIRALHKVQIALKVSTIFKSKIQKSRKKSCVKR